MGAGFTQPAQPRCRQIGNERGRVRGIDDQWRQSSQNVLSEVFRRFETLQVGEVFPIEYSNAALFESGQERRKAIALLLHHADDYGAEIGEKLNMRRFVLEPQDRNSLHEE